LALVVESIENVAVERLDIAGGIAADTTAAPLSCSREDGADLIAYAPFLKRIPIRIVGTDLQLKPRDDCISVVAFAGEPLGPGSQPPQTRWLRRGGCCRHAGRGRGTTILHQYGTAPG
jgi:hypothetical protein